MKRERFCFGIDTETGSPVLDSLRRKLADAAQRALPDVRAGRPDHFKALVERALYWRQSAYPEPHTAAEAEDYSAGREADRAQLEALIASSGS